MTKLPLHLCLVSAAGLAGCLGEAASETLTPPQGSAASQEEVPSVWAQWGGPGRDFSLPVAPVLEWGQEGPKELWRQPLGYGESAVLTDGQNVFATYRDGDDEVIRSMTTNTGETAWEMRVPTPLWDGFFQDEGAGPYATPTIAGTRLLTVTVTGTLLCLDTQSGELQWRANVWSEWQRDPSKSGPAEVGYSPSPLVLDDRVFVVGGGNGHAVQAYDLATGALLASYGDFDPGYASPRLIEVGGRHLLVVLAAETVFGFDPETGSQLFEHPHPTDYRVNAMTPVWNGETLILSSAYDTGSRGLLIQSAGEGVDAAERWNNKRAQVHHSSAVISNGLFVGSSGDFGPAFLFGIDPNSGEMLFRERGFAKANLVAVGERIVLLDEDGQLALIEVSADGVGILGQKEIFETRSWAAPSIVGRTIYARDRQEVVAMQFGS